MPPSFRRDPELAVVGARVQEPGANRRLVQGDDGAVGLRAGGIGRDAAGGPGADPDLHRVLMVRSGEIANISSPRFTDFMTRLDRRRTSRVVDREEERSIPVPAQLSVERILVARPGARPSAPSSPWSRAGGVAPHQENRVLPLEVLRTPVRLGQAGLLAGREVRAGRCCRPATREYTMFGSVGSCAVTKPSPPPMLNHCALVIGTPAPARAAPGAVVLQSAADPVGHRHIVAHVVELADRDDVEEDLVAARGPRSAPTPPSLPTTMCSGSSGSIHMGVMVDVDALGRGAHRLAAVGRRRFTGVDDEVDPVGILRIDPHLRVVEGAHVLRLHLRPGLPAVHPTGRARSGGLRLGATCPASALASVSASTIVYMICGLLAAIVDPMRPLRGLGEAVALHLGPGLTGVGALPEAEPGPPLCRK